MEGEITRMALLLGFMLLFGEVVGSNNDAERRNVCRKFTADTKLQNLIASGRRGAEPCPCIEQKIKLDDTFEKIENCYRQWFYREGAKQICCYSEIGNLILEGPGAGYLLVEGKEEAIENAHRHCCGNISPKLSCQSFYEINPPDNCRAYVPPSVVTSSGDPRIETIDGKSYFFNGHGEYVFLKDSKNFEIQARTDYVIKGNNDSTMFTAFAFFHKTSSEQIELHYDRESKDIRFYRNGTYKENCNASTTGGKGHTYPCEGGEKHRCSILAGDGKIIVQGCGLGNYAKQLTFQSQSFMRIEISRGKDNNTVNILGLAGHGKGGYSMRNGSRVNTTSPQKMFEFGESWSLQNLSESHFKYASTGGNFTFYNKHHSRPKFLEDLVGNLSALFANFTSENIIRFNNTCRNYWNHEPNKQCLLTIARTGDYDLGVEEMKEANSTHRKLMIINNRPPQFKENTTKNATVKYGGTWTFNLSKYVEDDQNDTLVYTVDTKIPQTEFNLTKDGFFTWTVGEGLRKIDTSIIFRVNDTFNVTAVQEIKIVYCGCENSSDCNFEFPLPSKLNSSGDIIRASCVCQEYHSGVFCENQTNPCDGVKCFASCNAAIPKTGDFWPCAKCPKGLKDVGIIGGDQKCPDLDECAAGYEADDKCEQNCTNTDGSFVCSCRSGYQLHSNGYNCEDIDECNRNLKYCGKTEICVNTIGDATCECASGYTRKIKNGSCTEVDGGSYAGSIVFQLVSLKTENGSITNKTINTAENRNIVQEKLRTGFNSTPGFISVEVVELFVIPEGANNTRRKRDAGTSYNLHSKYVVHMTNKTKDATTIQTSLQNSFQKSNASKVEIHLGNTRVLSDNARIKVESNALCSLEDTVNCDLHSTICNDTGGDYDCICKAGYERAKHSNNFCTDIDECHFSQMESDLCVKGKCENTPGSWKCNCNADTELKNTTHLNILRFRCEGDYQYVGKAEVRVSAPPYNISYVYELFGEVVTKSFEGTNKTNMIGSTTPSSVHVSDIFTQFEVLNRSSDVYNGSSLTVYYILHLGEPLMNEQVDLVQNETLSNIVGEYFNNTQVNITLLYSSIFQEDDFNLCDIEGKTDCVLETTNCIVRNGTYSCPCKSGYKRLTNNYCTDVNECTDGTAHCLWGDCLNTVGNWTCTCNSTSEFKWINETYGACQDMNECIYPDKYRCYGPINDSATCKDKVAGWSCNCDDGYTPRNLSDDIRLCDDVDECLTDRLSCQGGGTCQNTNGTFYCFCPPGFTNSTHSINSNNATHITCTDIDECNTTTVQESCIKGICDNTLGNWFCNCSNKIYSTRKELENGSFRCLGNFQYVGHIRLHWVASAGLNNTTVEVFFHNEIQKKFNQSTFVLQNGSDDKFTMSDIFRNLSIIPNISIRDAGYHSYSVNITYIIQIGEPLGTKDVKNFQHEIFKTPKEFIVNPGPDHVFLSGESVYSDSDYSICNISGMTKCDDETTNCIASNGSYTCQCKEGYNSTNDRYSCEDINECTDGNHTCQNNGTCQNVEGNWTCKCPSGYEPEVLNKHSISCIDINECHNNTLKYQCTGPENSFSCDNDDGGWQCNCNKGYTAKNVTDDYRICEDINECNDTLSCIGGNCTNINGAFECTCPNGYYHSSYGSGNYTNCTDIDECTSVYINNSCIHGTCQNVDGGWNCMCIGTFDTLKHVGNGTFRCLGDFQYFAHATFMLLPPVKSSKDELLDNFNEKISKLYSQSKITINYIQGSSAMSDIFRNISEMEVNLSSNGGTTTVDVSYIIHIGESSSTEALAEFQTKLFDPSKHIELRIGPDTALLQTAEIFKDSTHNLCNLNGTTKCDLRTTTCKSHNGSYSCPCKDGFNTTEDPFKCSDVDECLDSLHNCDNSSNCTNTVGNWTCSCPSGFEPEFVDAYNISCTDIDECQHTHDYICDNGNCTNSVGSWLCECPSGFNLHEDSNDSFTCLDINECTNVSYSCQNGGNCSNADGNWTCICPLGFEPKKLDMYSIACNDINECNYKDKYHCTGPSASCTNTDGDWQCACKDGYSAKHYTYYDRVCEDNNECENAEESCFDGYCTNRNGTFDCVCRPGYTNRSADIGTKHINCTDIDECVTNKAETINSCVRGSCENTPGDWMCYCSDTRYSTIRDLGNHKFRCLGDFQYVGQVTLQWVPYASKTKQEVDLFFNKTISEVFAKTNATLKLPNNASLPVSNVFKSLEVLNVTNIPAHNVLNVLYIIHIGEPVTSKNVADTQHTIFSTLETYPSGTGYVSVQHSLIHNDTEFNLCDIDGKTKCGVQSTDCVVNNGSYSCRCKSGYQETTDPFHCKDVDECSIDSYKCTTGEKCNNTLGNWTCDCKTGYEAIFTDKNHIKCKNINECRSNETYICSGGKCVDDIGGWNCSCPTGFYAEPIQKGFIYNCKDVDECSTNLHKCTHGGTCHNTHGNWTCDCPAGYEAAFKDQHQIECQNIIECKNPDLFSCTGPPNSSTCHDVPGTWECKCNKGYDPKNISTNIRTCEDINECHDESSCQKGECINTEGSFICQCDPGYKVVSGAGYKACDDIDECIINETPCLESLGCENIEGDWTCLCAKGLDVRIINESSKICGGQYQYVSSMSFTVVGEIMDVATIQAALQKQIQEMYMQTLNDDSVWIEIIKIHGLQSSERRKRAPARDISAEYIIHSAEKKNKTELQAVEENYKKQKCGNGTNNCPAEDIGGVSMVFNYVLNLNDSAICNTTRNHCDKGISTCSSDEGKLECVCNDGYEKKNANSLQCFDKDECKSSVQACQNGTVCHNTEGSWDCSCQKGLKAIETTAGKKECIDPCKRKKCFLSSTCEHFDNDDGYICGCAKGRKGKYCTETDQEFKDSKQQTILIAVGSSLGGLVVILTGVILAVCRWRAGKIKEAERISMKNFDTNGFKSFNDSFLTNHYMRDRDDGGGSFYSHRLSNKSLPHVQQNGGHRNGYLPESVYSIPHRLPRPNYHGSMPNLANGDAHFNRSDNRRYSVEEPRRFSSYNQGMESNYDIDWRARGNNVTGRRSPSPDYGRRSSPRPDYHRMNNLNRSKDSGVGNGYSSESNDYRRPDKRREYYYGNRNSTQF